MKVAKLSLAVDTASFKRSMNEAQAALKGFYNQVNQQQRQSSSSPSNPWKSFGATGGNVSRPHVAPASAVRDSIFGAGRGTPATPGRGAGPTGGAGGGGGGFNPMSMLGMIGGPWGKALAVAGGIAGTGMGLTSLYQRRQRIAEDNLSIRALTGGSTVGGMSRFGFDGDERRQRALGLAGASGRNMSQGELSGLTDQSEKLSRAFGISGESSSGFVGASRKAGIENQSKFLATTIATATASKLSGSRIGEYLQAMTTAVESMSEGINIDGDSLNAFAGTLSGMDFFKSDPRRAFRTAEGLNSAFSGGDRYQQAQAARAISMGSPGASPAAIEMRRKMGIFGKFGKKDLADLKGVGMDADTLKTLGMSGEQIVNNLFKDVNATSGGLSADQKMFSLGEKLNIKDMGALKEMYVGMEQNGGDFSKLSKGLKGRVSKGMESTDDMLRNTFSGLDSKIVELNAKLKHLIDALSSLVAEPVTRLAEALEGQLGFKRKDVGSQEWMGDSVRGAAKGHLRLGAKAMFPLATGLADATGVSDSISGLFDSATGKRKTSVPGVTPDGGAGNFIQVIASMEANTKAMVENTKAMKTGSTLPSNASVIPRGFYSGQ